MDGGGARTQQPGPKGTTLVLAESLRRRGKRKSRKRLKRSYRRKSNRRKSRRLLKKNKSRRKFTKRLKNKSYRRKSSRRYLGGMDGGGTPPDAAAAAAEKASATITEAEWAAVFAQVEKIHYKITQPMGGKTTDNVEERWGSNLVAIRRQFGRPPDFDYKTKAEQDKTWTVYWMGERDYRAGPYSPSKAKVGDEIYHYWFPERNQLPDWALGLSASDHASYNSADARDKIYRRGAPRDFNIKAFLTFLHKNPDIRSRYNVEVK